MSGEISRRSILRGTLAGATVIAGFDTELRSWVSAAELERALAPAEDFPIFDGVLLLDEASRTAAADDFGHIVHREPLAVLRPGSVSDVVKLVKFARRNNIEVAARGQAHSTQGQAQVEAGVVVDLATLSTVHEPNSRHFYVFALLRNAIPPTPERALQLVAANRTLFERAVKLGGKRYPFDSVPMTKHDWQKHYQPLWGAFVSAKRHFDPDEILTPGPGIF